MVELQGTDGVVGVEAGACSSGCPVASVVPVTEAGADVLDRDVVDEPARPDRAVLVRPDTEAEVDVRRVVDAGQVVQIEHGVLPTGIDGLREHRESMTAVPTPVGASGDSRAR